jgi:hypothetical protein
MLGRVSDRQKHFLIRYCACRPALAGAEMTRAQYAFVSFLGLVGVIVL